MRDDVGALRTNCGLCFKSWVWDLQGFPELRHTLGASDEAGDGAGDHWCVRWPECVYGTAIFLQNYYAIVGYANGAFVQETNCS